MNLCCICDKCDVSCIFKICNQAHESPAPFFLRVNICGLHKPPYIVERIAQTYTVYIFHTPQTLLTKGTQIIGTKLSTPLLVVECTMRPHFPPTDPEIPNDTLHASRHLKYVCRIDRFYATHQSASQIYAFSMWRFGDARFSD